MTNRMMNTTRLLITVLMCLSMLAGAAMADYNGTAKVYLVEPDSRWDFQTGEDIHQGLLDILESAPLSLSSGESASGSHIWDASADAGYSGVGADNLEAIVTVFNATGHDEDAWPPYGYWFTAHDADATVAVMAGEGAEHQTGPGFTHTVFIEEGSATWCENCPNVAADLHAIDQGGSYLFHYASLVAETPGQTEPAYSRLLADLNRPGYPCLYLDGGFTTVIGDLGQAAIESALSTAGSRTVPQLDLVARMSHLGSDQFRICYRVAFEADANAAASVPAAPTGDASGSTGQELTFQAQSTDLESDSLYYQFDFDDGSDDTWYGPYASGVQAQVTHSWSADGAYGVSVRTKDIWGKLSDWSDELTVVSGGGGCCIFRGDIDHTGAVPDISDLVYLVTFMFSGGPEPPCMEEADVDGLAGGPDISDLVYLVTYMFSGGAPPPPCP